MSFQRLTQTAQEYWAAFEHYNENGTTPQLFSRETEKLRFLSLLAFTSLDAQVNAFWVSRVTPEWDSILSLINHVLDDSQELAGLLDLSGPDLNRAQLISSLRFLSHVVEPAKFAPTFIDCGILWLLTSEVGSKNPKYVRIAKMLFHLQKIRNSCFNTGRDFNELKGKEALFLFHQWKDLAPAFHPAFAAPESWDADPIAA